MIRRILHLPALQLLIFPLIYLLLVLIFALTFTPSPALASIRIPVLMYHYIRNFTYPGDPEGHILSVSLNDFDAQMSYLSTHGYIPVSLNTAYAIETGQVPSPPKPIVLTFDDGTIDFYAWAYPILKKYHFQATSFVITGFVGRPAYLSWNNIHEMEGSGLISFESHTVDHRNLAYLGHSDIMAELIASKGTLEQETGKRVNFLAYPDGGSNFLVWRVAQQAGYIGAFGTWFGYMYTPTMDSPRIRVSGGEPLSTFIRNLGE